MSSSIISGDSTINTDESTSGNINSYDHGNNSNKATTKQIIPPPPIYSSSQDNKSSSISSPSISISSQKSSMINTICCTIHPSIQLKRRRRRRTTNNNNNTNDDKSSNDDNEECWIQLIKECPLCTADDDDSVWSGRTSGSVSRCSRSTSSSSSSNKTLQSSPKSSNNDKKKIYNSAPVNTPSPPPTAPRQILKRLSTTTTTNTTNSNNKEYIPSKFKESKDNGEYDNEEDLSQIEQSSQKDSYNFPSLPFTQEDHNDTTTTSSINERTSSIKQMIQCRKMKLEELKLRSSSSNSSNSRLTPPSQRYMNNKLSIEEEDSLGEEQVASVKSSQRSFHSESTKCISNSTAITATKDTNEDTKDKTKPSSNNNSNNNMLETSFYSNVSHSCGSPQKDKLALTVMPKLSRCNSDSTLSSTVKQRDDQRQHQHQQHQQHQQSYYNKSILDISYDSFVDESVRQFFNYNTNTNDEVSASSSIVKEDSSRVMKEEEKDNTATKEEEQVSCITLDVSNRSSDKEKNDHIDTTTTLKQQQVDSKKKSQPHSQQKHKVKRKAKSKDDLLNTATYDIWGSNSSNNCVEASQATTVTTTTDDVAADDKKELIQLSNKLYSLVYPRRTNTMENKNPRHPSVKQDTPSKKSMSNNMNDVNNDLQSMNIEEEVDVSMNVSPTLSSIHDNNTRKEDADDDSYENENDGYSISEESLLGEEPPGYTSVNNKLKRYDDNYNNEVSSTYTQDDPPGDNMSTDSDYYYTRSSPGVSTTTSSSDSYSLGFDDYATNNPRGGVSHYSMECSSDESRRSSRSSHPDERRRERSRDNHPNNPSILRNSISSKSRSSSSSKETSRIDRETTSRRSNSTGSSSIAKSKSSSKGSGSSTVRTQESVKTFCQYDPHTGRCIHHPHIQLRRKRRLGGFKKGQWKIISMNCTECAFEEVQRLRARALKKQQQLKPCSSSVGQKSQYTSATESSSRYTSSDDSASRRDNRIPKGILKKHPSGYHYIDESSTTNGSSISLPSISETQSYSTASSTSTPVSFPPRGILRKPNKHVAYDNESSFLSSSTELSGLSESCYSDSTGSSSCVSSGKICHFFSKVWYICLPNLHHLPTLFLVTQRVDN